MPDPIELTCTGIHCLEQAILDVLRGAWENGSPLQIVDIAKAIGIAGAWREATWFPRAVLYKLEEEGRV